ncbi:30S ribosomal protein S21 [Wolbachia endosymbiont of Pentidionis agamae]|uniref:30S ribosomal protein S21 n=1 Tax=Wolbachia endosymbiont of Pentidionis agamae TaxID=3110435 RepID=UPI002FD1DA64
MIEVPVYHNDVEQALRALKKKMQKEGKQRKMKKRFHETKSEERAKKNAEIKKRKNKARG